ncbi:MAG: hypothetical protein GTN74_11640 [Proteobacteria bacterium]|nr:hypothetical protein [Pseudomonadota bacterium]NIS70930.1 hypothetical protein [Pseudomonadota bacterium]
MKFKINIYRPGRRGKEIKEAKAVPKEPSASRVPIFVFVGIIILIVLGYGYLYSGQIATLKRKMRSDQKQILMLRQFLTQVDTNQKSGVNALLVRLAGQRVLWKEKLVDLSRLVPDDIRLTRLSMQEVEKTPDPKQPRKKVKETVLTIVGETLTAPGKDSLDHIARLITNLNESSTFSGDFEPLALVYTQRVKTRDREFMEFELSGRLLRKGAEG